MSPIQILVVEDQPERAARIADLVRAGFGGNAEIRLASCAAEACELLKERRVDALILDPTLPDEWGCEGLVRIRAQESDLPLVIAAPPEFADFAAAVLDAGSDGTLPEDASAEDVRQLLEQAISRRKSRESEAASMLDPETGLRNRAGLEALLPEWVKLATLADRELLFFHARVGGEERLDSGAMQLALLDAATVLRETFRGSDVVARTGANEFVAIALVHPGDDTGDILAIRLDEQLRARNARSERRTPLMIDFAMARSAADAENAAKVLSATMERTLSRGRGAAPARE